MSACSKNPEACITTDKKTDRFSVDEFVHFYANCSQNAESYEWAFDQGSAATKVNRQSVRFKFEKAGRYLVKLKASNRNQSSEAVMVVYVYEN
jgi:PKD repeat protein